jgi:hypothetical protein
MVHIANGKLGALVREHQRGGLLWIANKRPHSEAIGEKMTRNGATLLARGADYNDQRGLAIHEMSSGCEYELWMPYTHVAGTFSQTRGA